MNSFEYGFFDALEKIAVTAAELREANKRVRLDSGVVSSHDLRAGNLQGFLARSALDSAGPSTIMGSLPIDSVQSGPLKDELVRRGHKRVITTTPDRNTDAFLDTSRHGRGLSPSDREFFRDAINFHETREAQRIRKKNTTLADFAFSGINPDRAKKVIKTSKGFASHEGPQIYLDDINQAVTAGKSSREAARIHGSDPKIQRQQREADLRAMQSAKDSGDKNWRLARDKSGPAAQARAQKAALDAHEMGLGQANLKAKLKAKKAGIPNYKDVKAGEGYQIGDYDRKVKFGDSPSADLSAKLKPEGSAGMLNLRHTTREVEDLPNALASTGNKLFKDTRVKALLSGRDTNATYKPGVTPPHYVAGQKIPKWLRKEVNRTWEKTPLEAALQTQGVPKHQAAAVAESIRKSPEQAAANLRALKIMGTGAAGLAAGYGGYKLYKYLKNKNKKKGGASEEPASKRR